MKKALLVVIALCVLLTVCRCAPADQKDSPKEAQSAFVPAFDEIVVESQLTVRRKNESGRQGRNKNTPKSTTAAPTTIKTEPKVKRQISGFSGFSGFNRPANWPNFSSSVSNAHAQANNVHGPLGSFGSSATHSQNQAFNVGPNGLVSSGNLAATQHYYFPNGMKIDVNFSGSGAATNGHNSATSSSSVIVTDPSGSKRIHN